MNDRPLFKRGDLVFVRGKPNQLASIIDGPRRTESGFEYQILIDNTLFWFAEHLVIAASSAVRWSRVTREELLRDMAITKLSHRLSDALYTYKASRTSFEAYQFHPVIKFVRNPSHRILIADEVGLGKTIEAALIYLELKERLSISRTMVLCPSRLTHKWQSELSNRFDEQFTVLDSRSFQQSFGTDGSPRNNQFRVITSFETLRRREALTALSQRLPQLDLLIVDEAHYMRNETSRTFLLGSTLVDLSDAVIFLTATPLHLRNRDLFNLVNMLAPEEFSDNFVFEELLRPNRHLFAAMRLIARGLLSDALEELKCVEQTSQARRFTKNPYYREVCGQLEEYVRTQTRLMPSERVRLQRDVQDLNTLSNVVSRTRKREVAKAAVRAAYSIRVTLTPEERRLYDLVLDQARHRLRTQGTGATGWGIMMPERQAASCLPAIANRFKSAAYSHLELDIDRSPFDMFDNADEQSELSATMDIAQAAAAIRGLDSKFDRFFEVLTNALAENASSKAIVFSFFKSTLRYLAERLRSRGIPFELLSGDVPVRERPAIIDRFRERPDIRVLLSSEVGAEGLDFQFCDVLINYDLPWNPMQVEQRIGRLDRFGQKHERIRIYNLFIEDSIETRIFERLYERIGLFEQSIGDLESILGEQISELSRQVVQGRLTPAEEERLLIETTDRIERERQDIERLESSKDELMGPTDILDQQVAETIQSGRFISKEEVQSIVRTFLVTEYPRSVFEHDDSEPVASIRFDSHLREALRRFILQQNLLSTSSLHLQSITSGKRDVLPITFDAEFAQSRPLLDFVTIRHPLTRMAIAHWRRREHDTASKCDIVVAGKNFTPGAGYYFVYLVEIGGATESITLEPVLVLADGSIAPDAAERVLSSIQATKHFPGQFEDLQLEFDTALDIAERQIALLRTQKEQEARKRNDALILARSTATRSTFEAKIRRTQHLLDTTSEENIARMRRSQIANLEARMESKLQEIESKRDLSVGSRLIAGGRARIIAVDS